jgi:hypothetical protein
LTRRSPRCCRSVDIADTSDPGQQLILESEVGMRERCRATGDVGGAWEEYERTVDREWTVNAVSELQALWVEFDRVAEDHPTRGPISLRRSSSALHEGGSVQGTFPEERRMIP